MSQNFAAQTALKSGGGIGFGTLDANGNLLVAQGASPIVSATQLSASSGNVAAASAVATLAGVAAKTTYIAGFSITAGGATGAALVSATVVGVISGTQTYTFATPAGATLGATPLFIRFDPPLPASAANTAIVVTLPSLGTGNTNACVNAWGYQK